MADRIASWLVPETRERGIYIYSDELDRYIARVRRAEPTLAPLHAALDPSADCVQAPPRTLAGRKVRR